MPTSTELKTKLEELIKNSPALNSLEPAEREKRTSLMLASDDEIMQQYIDVLEEEAVEMEKINKEFEKEAENIEKLLVEVKQLKKEADREMMKEEERTDREEDQQRTDDLLSQLDNIEEESKK